MRSRYHVGHQGQAHFVTSTIIEWLPVFTNAACCDILVHALRYCQEHKELQIYAWVILDNHFHAILAASDLSRTLASIKRHTARQIVAWAEAGRREWLLNQLSYYRAKHKAQSDHQIWQEGFHPQELSTDREMNQKIDYIHHNPVARGLVSRPEHWRYSSAHEELAGGQPVLRCDRCW